MMVIIDDRHYYAAIIVRDGMVIDAAPILKWTKGKKIVDVLAYGQRRGWKVEVRYESSERARRPDLGTA